jgi:two-component system, LuxR family, sensor kinase FixL
VLDARACDLGDVWREAWSQVLVQYPGREARLEEDLGGTTLACEADRFRLGQMFANLFANALDACPDPVRVVVVCREALLGDRPALRVTVRDNGPGFNPEQRRHAFEPFHTTKAKGTGLGLAIVKRIVDKHGGTIAIDDSPEGGAITLTLPRQQIGTTAP